MSSACALYVLVLNLVRQCVNVSGTTTVSEGSNEIRIDTLHYHANFFSFFFLLSIHIAESPRTDRADRLAGIKQLPRVQVRGLRVRRFKSVEALETLPARANPRTSQDLSAILEKT